LPSPTGVSTCCWLAAVAETRFRPLAALASTTARYHSAVARQWFSRTPGDDESAPWFRIGTVDIGTAALVAMISAAMMVVIVIGGLQFYLQLPMSPVNVLRGQVWRLFTWPFANLPSIWNVLTIALFWYFGKRLEEEVGRTRMAKLVGILALSFGVLAIAVNLAFRVLTPGLEQPVLTGLNTLQLVILLIFIAQYPTAMFFFNIPGWVIGAVLVALPVLTYLFTRDPVGLLNFLLSLGIAAVIAKSMGLLSEYPAIPGLGTSRRQARPPGRRGRSLFRRQSRGGQAVVAGPWAGSSAPDRAAGDRARLDALLDKISASGMESLSSKEVKELHHLRKRLRGE
jgi:hypothetical protein